MIRGDSALKSATYWVKPPPDHDRAGIWRLGGSVGLLLGLAALNEAHSDRNLSPAQRLVAGAFAGAYAAGGAYTLVAPDWLPRAVITRPRRTLAAAFAPLAAEGPSGGAHTPLQMLTAASAGSSAVVYGQRTGARVAHYAGVMWSVQARATSVRTRPLPPASWVHVVLPLTYQIVARLTAALASLAYNARSLDAMLRDLTDERQELRGIAVQLDTALHEAGPRLVAVLDDLTPAQRNQALRALGRLHESLAALRVALHDRPDASRRPVRRIRRAFRARRLGQADRAVPTRTQTLASICETQLEALAELLPAGVEVSMTVDPQLRIEGVDRIALLAASVTAGIANAVRHAERLSAIAISAERLDDDRLQLRVVNDGVAHAAPPPHGRGLQTLADELARVSGTLETATADGCFELRIAMPPRAPQADSGRLATRAPQADSGHLLPWDRIEGKIDVVLAEIAHLCGAMVAAQLVGRRLRGRGRVASGALLSVLPPVAYALDERRGRHSPWPLVAAAAVGATARGPQRGILCGWCNAALSRHTMRNTRAQTELLLALNAAALIASYASARNRRPLGGQLATLVAGPLAATRIVWPAIDRLRSRESDVIATLAAIETVHRIVQDFHRAHSCIGPMERLAADPALARAQRMALNDSVGRIKRATREYGDVSTRLLRGLVGEVCTVIGRRVYPASLAVDVDRGAVGAVDPGLGRMRLRLTAIAVADAVAREVISYRPAHLDGTRGVKRVEVHVGGPAESPSVHFRVRPVVRRDEASERRLCARIDELGGGVVAWRDGELTFALYPTP